MKILPIGAADAADAIHLPLPLSVAKLECGFPSPADDYVEKDLDLNEHLIDSPSSTFFARANGDSLNGNGIYDGDLLIVNRGTAPRNGSVVVVALNGELTCKILDTRRKRLRSSNPSFPDIPYTMDTGLMVEGVVTHAIHYLVP